MKAKPETTLLSGDSFAESPITPVPPVAPTHHTWRGETLEEPEEDARAPTPLARALLPERYADRGLLGMGGMGEVRRVYDRVLDRCVAMKLVRGDRALTSKVLDHFGMEARATARLAHPGIIPVFDHGHTPDGRPYFTMQEIRGESLADLIYRLHQLPKSNDLPGGFRRLVDVVERAARAVAFAHDQGVVHRDLKPGNILVGDHGEVMVVDWGLVRAAGIEQRVAGTPVYMAPEQARAAHIDATADVYGLGMVLWELCAGHHPFQGADTEQVLAALRANKVPGAPPSPWFLPEELLQILTVATAASPEERPVDGSAFANLLRAWLDGETRRERARAGVRHALAVEASIRGREEEEQRLRAEASRLLAATQPWEPDTTREEAWAAEDAAEALARSVVLAKREVDDALEAALIHDPDCIDAHAALARRLCAAQAAAEAANLAEQSASLESRLRRHLNSLPSSHPERLQAEDWLKGDGCVSLQSDPPGATVMLYRYQLQRRRLVPVPMGTLGQTPLHKIPLARGSWLLELQAPQRATVRYPVQIDRQAHWDGIAPGDAEPAPILLPKAEEIGEEEVVVAAGWVDLGGDAQAPSGLPPRRVWVDGFVMRRFPVTNRAYLRFLNDLVVNGRTAEAFRHVPRDREAMPGTPGKMFYGRTDDGLYFLTTDTDGHTWNPDWPVMMVDHVSAWAYARWEAQRSGLPWRLPGELEWEKAARGVDRRLYPWGDFADTTWCNTRTAHASYAQMEVVGSRPTDVSPYGVRDMAGGMVEWTATRMTVEGPPGARALVADGSEESEASWAGRKATWRIVGRGGSRLHNLNAARVGFRLALDPWTLSTNLSFRIVRSLG